MQTANLPQFVTADDIRRAACVSKPTFSKMVRDGLFPPPVMFGTRSRRWPASVLIDLASGKSSKAA